jgi:hypothetical protein
MISFNKEEEYDLRGFVGDRVEAQEKIDDLKSKVSTMLLSLTEGGVDPAIEW